MLFRLYFFAINKKLKFIMRNLYFFCSINYDFVPLPFRPSVIDYYCFWANVTDRKCNDASVTEQFKALPNVNERYRYLRFYRWFSKEILTYGNAE